MTTEGYPLDKTVYLIVDNERLFEIAVNSILNIGRLETNDVVLDDYKVSRDHAVIKSNGEEIMLLDLASTHGTLVNDQRIDRCLLQAGDRIAISDHQLYLCEEIPEELAARGMSVTVPRTSRSLDRRLKFFGGLNEFSLLTLVQFLVQEKQSGLLLMEIGQNPGPRLYFREGEIIHVSEESNLAELLTRQEHDPSLFFYFHHETNFPNRTIFASAESYLMHLCQTFDQREHRPATAITKTNSLAITSRIELPPPRV